MFSFIRQPPLIFGQPPLGNQAKRTSGESKGVIGCVLIGRRVFLFIYAGRLRYNQSMETKRASAGCLWPGLLFVLSSRPATRQPLVATERERAEPGVKGQGKAGSGVSRSRVPVSFSHCLQLPTQSSPCLFLSRPIAFFFLLSGEREKDTETIVLGVGDRRLVSMSLSFSVTACP